MRSLSQYGVLVRRVGVFYAALLFVVRLPVAMTIFGTVTFVTLERGSVADAGLASAALAVATAVAQPLHGRWTQHAGQRLPLLLLAPVCAAALVALVVATRSGASLPVLLALSAAVGASNVPVGGLSRVRWGQVTHSVEEARTATSLESVAEELAFVAGPAVVGILSAAVDPAAPLLVNAALALVLVPVFALHPLSPGPAGGEAPGSPEDTASMLRVLRSVWVPVAGMPMVGTYFGATQTTVAATTVELGSPGSGGLIYAVIGVGSAATALTAVALPARLELHTRVSLAATVMGLFTGLAALTLLGTAPGALWALGALMLLSGAGVGITLVSLFAIVGDDAPPAGVAVAMTAASAANVLGVAFGASLGGRVAESVWVGAGYFVSAAACVVLATLLGAAGLRRRTAG